MLGSAAQNIIALTDSVFLYYLGEADFAAIGFVGVFYLTVTAIGYGFSKGGQIIIARRMGGRQPDEVRRAFYSMLYFELALAVVMFLFMQYGCESFFKLFIDSPLILEKSLEFLEYRSWGIFASFAGVALIALYTGIARTSFLLVEVFVLAGVNILLGFGLIFGYWGLPAMGMAGAGLASTIAEFIGLAVFLIYMFFDKGIRPFKMLQLPKLEIKEIKNIGASKRAAVVPIIWKTAKMCWAVTMVISLPVVIFPQTMLYPLLGKEDMSLIVESQPVLWILLGILSLFSIASVYFNGLSGTGATMVGLKVQAVGVLFYVVYIYLVVEVMQAGLVWAWAAELFYWVFIFGYTLWYLRSKEWHRLSF
ncbi:MAG: MATE family efflux transporter [Saprospirales bacterium]|nr:MATE family efflux transporter [Saprospirales bacterium]